MKTDHRNVFLLLECKQLLCSFLEKFIQKIIALLQDEEEQEGEKVRRTLTANPDTHYGSPWPRPGVVTSLRLPQFYILPDPCS